MKNTKPMFSGKTHLDAEALIAEFRGKTWSEADVLADLVGLREGLPSWRRELLYALSHANGIPLAALYQAIGVAPAVVMQRRRKDAELAQAVQNYLGAYFEAEAMNPLLDMAPNVLVKGLEKHADGWKEAEGRVLTDEDLHLIIRAVVDSVRLRVNDAEILKQIGADIAATLDRFQVTKE